MATCEYCKTEQAHSICACCGAPVQAATKPYRMDLGYKVLRPLGIETIETKDGRLLRPREI